MVAALFFSACNEELNVDPPAEVEPAADIAPETKSMVLSAKVKQDKSIKVQWPPVKGASGTYRVHYRLQGTDTWDEDITTTPYYMINANTDETYEVEVFAVGRGDFVVNATNGIVTVSNVSASGKDDS